MLAALIAQAQVTASRTARNAALGAGGALCLFIGLGFITLALWLYLVSVMPPATAALIMGLGYIGLALILFGIISIKNRAYRRARARAVLAAQAQSGTPQTLTQMIMAFMTGIQAGRKARY